MPVRTTAGTRTTAGARTSTTRTTRYGLSFSGGRQYVTLGTMGTLGANLGSGFYCSCTLSTTYTGGQVGICGTNHSGGPELDIYLNWNGASSIPNTVCFNMRDTTGKRLEGYCTDSGLFDGNLHTLVITATPSTNTITISVDGVSQTITYVTQATPATFANWTTPFYVASWYNGAGDANWFTGMMTNFQIGTSSAALYGSYNFQEGVGKVAHDATTNSNTGTLSGSATPATYPTWTNTLGSGRNLVAPVTPLPIIIDTDATSDIDDYGAIACAFRLQLQGYCTILGINVDTSSTYTPGALDAMRKYLGIASIPISSHAAVGTFLPAAANACYQYVYNNFSHDVGLAASCSVPVTNLRTLLAARSRADVVVLGLGTGNDLAALLQSSADGISALNGIQLVAASCKLLVWTGGIYPSGTDPANFARDLTNAAYVINNWPTPIIFFPGGTSGFPIGGLIFTPNAISSLSSNNPCKAIYQQYGAPDSGHASWDLCTANIGIEGTSAWALTQGTNSLNTSTGVNMFTPGAGNHYYATNAQPYAYYQNHFTELMRV